MIEIKKARQAEIYRLVSDFFRGLKPQDPTQPAAGWGYVSEWLYHTVERGTYTNAEVMFLIDDVLREWGTRVAGSAIETGRREERETNATLRVFGAAVARACEETAKRDRAIACEVFEALVNKGDNASYAFYQAIEAIGGKTTPATKT